MSFRFADNVCYMANVAKVKIVGQPLAGVFTSSGFKLLTDEALDAETVVGFLQDAFTNARNSGFDHTWNAGVWDSFSVDWYEAGVLVGQATDDVPAGHDASGAIMPVNTCPVVSLYTPTLSRSGRGRFYLPPASKDAITTGGANGSASVIADWAQEFFQALALNDLTVYVGPSMTGSLSSHWVTKIRVGNQFDHQDRRKQVEDYEDRTL